MRMSEAALSALVSAFGWHRSSEYYAVKEDYAKADNCRRWRDEELAKAGLPSLDEMYEAHAARHAKLSRRNARGEKRAATYSKAELVEAVRAHAVRHYEQDGWDYVIEAWDTADIEKAIGRARTTSGAIAAVKRALAPLAEYRAEVVATGEW